MDMWLFRDFTLHLLQSRNTYKYKYRHTPCELIFRDSYHTIIHWHYLPWCLQHLINMIQLLQIDLVNFNNVIWHDLMPVTHQSKRQPKKTMWKLLQKSKSTSQIRFVMRSKLFLGIFHFCMRLYTDFKNATIISLSYDTDVRNINDYHLGAFTPTVMRNVKRLGNIKSINPVRIWP